MSVSITDLCRGCGKPWPCPDADSTLAHHRTTQAEADALFRRELLDVSENEGMQIVPGNPCAEYGHIPNDDGRCADCGAFAIALPATPEPRHGTLIDATCAECGETFDNCHCGEAHD